MAPNKSKYSQKIKDRAFKYYKQLDGSATAVSVKLRDRYGHDRAPSVVTVLKWAERYDWDGKIEKAQEMVRDALSQSDDPMVKQMVKDDLFMSEVVAILQGVVIETFKKRKSRFVPRNSNELVKLLDFIDTKRDKLIGKEKSITPAAQVDAQSLRDALRDILGDTPEGEQIEAKLIKTLRGKMRVLKGGMSGSKAG